MFIHSFNGHDVTDAILERYEAQKERGMTSYGFYLPGQDKLVHNIKETRIKTLLRRTKGKNDTVLFHHRRSTSTPDVRNACHPFSTKDLFENEYIGIHNGVISNTYDLKRDHTERGITYVSNQEPLVPGGYVRFNDSEALIYDLALYFENKIDKLSATGSNAFIVLKNDPTGKPTKLFFGHNSSNPLVMQLSKRSITIASLGKGELVPVNTLHIFDFETKGLRTIPMEIPVSNWKGNRTPTRTVGPTSTMSNAYRNSHEAQSPSQYSDDPHDGPRYNAYWDQRALEDKNWQPADDYVDDKAWNSDDDDDDLTDDDNMVIADMIRKNRERAGSENYTTPFDLEEYFGYDENGDFAMRPGSKREIKAALIKENDGRITAASLAAEGEAEGCAEEIRRVNYLGITETDPDKIIELLDYYKRLQEYYDTISEVAIQLYDDAKTQQTRAAKLVAAKKEDRSATASRFLSGPQKNINGQSKLLG